jgi:hypothetical protein
MTQRQFGQRPSLGETFANPWAWLFIAPVAIGIGIAFVPQYRINKVASLYSDVRAKPTEATARIKVVEGVNLRLNRRQLLRIQVTVTPASGTAYDTVTQAFHDQDIGVLLAMADSGKPVPVLLRADEPSKVILDTRRERWVREGLIQPSAVEYR